MEISIRKVSRRRLRITVQIGDSTLTIDIHQQGVGGLRGKLNRQPHYLVHTLQRSRGHHGGFHRIQD